MTPHDPDMSEITDLRLDLPPGDAGPLDFTAAVLARELERVQSLLEQEPDARRRVQMALVIYGLTIAHAAAQEEPHDA